MLRGLPEWLLRCSEARRTLLSSPGSGLLWVPPCILSFPGSSVRHQGSRAGVPVKASMCVPGAGSTWPERGSQRSQDKVPEGARLQLPPAIFLPRPCNRSALESSEFVNYPSPHKNSFMPLHIFG